MALRAGRLSNMTWPGPPISSWRPPEAVLEPQAHHGLPAVGKGKIGITIVGEKLRAIITGGHSLIYASAHYQFIAPQCKNKHVLTDSAYLVVGRRQSMNALYFKLLRRPTQASPPFPLPFVFSFTPEETAPCR